MKLSWESFTVHPRVPFTIARGTTTAYARAWVRLRDDRGSEGWGEAAPNAFYQESSETVHAALTRLSPIVAQCQPPGSLDDVAKLEEKLRGANPRDPSARAAISAAAHDLLGKQTGKPLFELFGLHAMTAPPSSFTIAISTDESEIIRRIEEAHRYPILKVKLGTDRDEWIVRTIRRAAPSKIMRADANAAWSVEQAIRMSAFLADNGFELLEQPLPRDDLAGFRELRKHARIPIIADESCLTAADLPRLDGAVDGINIKLSKCGGLAEARRMALEARARGMKVMLGCMIESSLGITAAAHLAPAVDYADLDGAALLSDDPFRGVSIEDGMIRLPDGPGLGVTRARG